MSINLLSRVTLCALAMAAVASPSRVAGQTTDDTGLWFAAFGNGELKLAESEDPSPLRWWFDAHCRFLDEADGFNQSILRPGLGVKVAEEQVLWAGYAWVHTSPIVGEDFEEHRFWQQWTWTPSIGDTKFTHRSRFEQRWFEDSEDTALRWRQMLRAQRVLSSCPEWSLIAWDEVFFHLNDTDRVAQAGFDQNRAFFGVGYRCCAEAPIRTEIGYLNQIINVSGRDDLMNHILSVNFFF